MSTADEEAPDARTTGTGLLILIVCRVLSWLYGLQALVVVPLFLALMYQGKQSMWVGDEFVDRLRGHNSGEAYLTLYFYLLFYAGPFVIPYAFFATWASVATRNNKIAPIVVRIQAWRLVLSGWTGVTFFVLHQSLFEFIRFLPNTWNGWLLIGWAVLTGRFVLVVSRQISTPHRDETRAGD